MSTCLSSKNGIKAKKAKRCCLCGERIEVGQMKDIRTGVNSEGFWTMHMHPECHIYEMMPNTVDPDWYEDSMEPAFTRKTAFAAVSNDQTPAKPTCT